MKKLFVLFFVISAIVMLNSCSFSTAGIEDVKMCTELNDSKCDSDKPIFGIEDQTIYVSCTIKNAPSDTKVNFSWYYTTDERLEIDVVSVTLNESGTFPVYSSLSAPYEGWPEGDYEVIIAIEGHEDKTVTKKFEVR